MLVVYCHREAHKRDVSSEYCVETRKSHWNIGTVSIINETYFVCHVSDNCKPIQTLKKACYKSGASATCEYKCSSRHRFIRSTRNGVLLCSICSQVLPGHQLCQCGASFWRFGGLSPSSVFDVMSVLSSTWHQLHLNTAHRSRRHDCMTLPWKFLITYIQST